MKTSTLLLFITAATMFGCSKKESVILSPEHQIKNTKWSGTYFNPDETLSRVLCLSFGNDDGFKWQDMYGTKTGKWIFEDGLLAITMTETGSQYVFNLADNKLRIAESLVPGDKQLSTLSKIENFPKQLTNSKWLNETKWSMHFQGNNVLLFQPKKSNTAVGDGLYVRDDATVSITNGQLGGTRSAAFFGVFINDKKMIGNFKTGTSLDTPAFISEEAYEYTLQ